MGRYEYNKKMDTTNRKIQYEDKNCIFYKADKNKKMDTIWLYKTNPKNTLDIEQEIIRFKNYIYDNFNIYVNVFNEIIKLEKDSSHQLSEAFNTFIKADLMRLKKNNLKSMKINNIKYNDYDKVESLFAIENFINRFNEEICLENGIFCIIKVKEN